jgi:starch synthase
MKVLFATSEAIPLVKTGGLADVSGALPIALRQVGVDCRLLLPGYPSVLSGLDDLTEVAALPGLANNAEGRLLAGSLPGSKLIVYVLQLPEAYERPGGPYQDFHNQDHADNAWRFAVFSQVAARLASPLSPLAWTPDILHCNDWQTGLAPAYLHFLGRPTPSVMTVHNLAFQGIFPPTAMAMTGLPEAAFAIEGLEYYGNVSYLKGGLYYADQLTTVSPSYAREIQSEPLGMGLQGLLSSRASQLTGIVNGIDGEEWNPSEDPHIARSYSAGALTGKKLCKLALQQELGLKPERNAPVFGLIARMTHQKGLDMVLACAAGIIAHGGQLVLLGTGVRAIEHSVREMVAKHPGQAACFIGYDEALSHRIEAGADLFLMPSRFEPCGLNQMYSLRYGTVPIVHATGGLRDTVEDGVTGFLFEEASAEALRQAIERALATYADAARWQQMMKAGMRRDFSWEKSAQQYVQVYRALLASREK